MIEVYYDNEFMFYWENYNDVPGVKERFFINCEKLYEVIKRDFFGNNMRIFTRMLKIK